MTEEAMRELIEGLRHDAGDFARAMSGETCSYDLSWDQSNVRAWRAADLIESMLVATEPPISGSSS